MPTIPKISQETLRLDLNLDEDNQCWCPCQCGCKGGELEPCGLCLDCLNGKHEVIPEGVFPNLDDMIALHQSCIDYYREVMAKLQQDAEWLAKLSELESKENKGRGVSCVKTIIHWLNDNDQYSAALTAENEFDKIRSYPEIAQLLRDMGLVKPDRI